jgi:hypothetical protein
MLGAASKACLSHRVSSKAAALLIWVYDSSQVFFLGAEFTRIHALRDMSPGRRS